MSKLIWAKKQSTTDAQQPTQGNTVEHLRLTQSHHRDAAGQVIDHTTYFRTTFFDSCAWSPGSNATFTGEVADVDFDCFVCGQSLGVQRLLVSHYPNRAGNNRAPTTHIELNQAITATLQANGARDRWVVVVREHDGSFHLVMT